MKSVFAHVCSSVQIRKTTSRREVQTGFKSDFFIGVDWCAFAFKVVAFRLGKA